MASPIGETGSCERFLIGSENRRLGGCVFNHSRPSTTSVNRSGSACKSGRCSFAVCEFLSDAHFSNLVTERFALLTTAHA